MDRGLYISAAGMLAEQIRQDQLASDLANASTPGYKPDRAAQESFGEVLIGNRETRQPVGSIGLGVDVDKIRVDMTQGSLRQTDEPLDLGLQGDGFFVVQTPNGNRYTRDGQLAQDAQGRLVTATGLLVLGDDGRPIAIPSGSRPEIGQDGTVRAGDRAVGRIAVVSLAAAAKEGDNLFTGTPGARPAPTLVRQGFLETSALDPAKAMVDMLVSMRSYESSQRVIHAIDDSLRQAISVAGSGGS